MFTNFTEETRKILIGAKKECSKLKHPYIGSEHLLLSILNNNNEISKKLKEYNIDYIKFEKEVKKIIGVGNEKNDLIIYTPLLKRVIENAILDSKDYNNGEVSISILFASLLEEGEGVALRILLELDVNLDELYTEFSSNLIKKTKKTKLLLEELGENLVENSYKFDPVIGRDNEIKRILEILSRKTKNNPILVGEAGTGKTAIVEELGRMISENRVPLNLRNKKIINLDMASLVAGTKYRGEFEEKLKKIIKEVEDNDEIILFIDEIHTLVGAGGAEGAIDASNILKPALARNKLRCIGATTLDEYKKFIEQDQALERRFQKVIINEPNMEQTKKILLSLKPIYEKYHKVILNDNIIDKIIELSNKYLYDRFEPDKSIDILDEVCAMVSLKESKKLKEYYLLQDNYSKIIDKKNEAIIKKDYENASKIKTEENNIINKINKIEINLDKNIKKVNLIDVANVINIKTGIPIYEIMKNNKKIIYNIENKLRDSVIGQDSAIDTMIKIAKKIKLGYKNKCDSILLAGPSGVGKTFLATIFGEVMNMNIIRLDMTEYVESHSVSKIIGSPPGYIGYNDNKYLLESIRNKPNSVIILDEIEKAHPSVINLFMQVLENSKMKDSTGKVVRFDNTIIIMTSNIGYLENHVGFTPKNNNYILNKLKDNFSLPFINRIDNIVLFNKLNEKNIELIIEKKLNILKNKYKIKINKKIINEIKEESNYNIDGARKIDKLILKIENLIIDELIDNKTNINITSLKKSIV